MQPVMKSIALAGAERQAQLLVTLSQPTGSLSAPGKRQLKTQAGAETTAGRAVIEYSGESSVVVVAAADSDTDAKVEVVDAARARELRVRTRKVRSPMGIEKIIVD
jgi:hypothetical protein